MSKRPTAKRPARPKAISPRQARTSVKTPWRYFVVNENHVLFVGGFTCFKISRSDFNRLIDWYNRPQRIGKRACKKGVSK